MGRPTLFTPELAERICEEIAESSKGLHFICKENEDFPNKSTVLRWLAIPENSDFRDQYARAREAQADKLAAEILAISDDGTHDTMTVYIGDVTKEVEDKEWVNRSKLRVDARKWLASKLAPKKYGDKIDVTTGGEKITTPMIIDWNENRANSEAEGGA